MQMTKNRITNQDEDGGIVICGNLR